MADAFQLNQAMEILPAYSLVRRNPTEKTFSIHRLVQAVLQDRLEETERCYWAERVMIAVNATFSLDEDTWLSAERLLLQALAAIQLIERCQIVSEEARWLLCKTASYLAARARYAEAEQFYQQAIHIPFPNGPVDLAKPFLGLADLYMGLADLYLAQGRYPEAEQFYRQAWEN